MRPIPFLGLATLLTLVALPALAGGSGVTVGSGDNKGEVRFFAPKGMHMNKDYPWKIKDGSGNTVKHVKNGDFAFEKSEHPAHATVVPAAGTLTGGYCDNDTNAPGAGCHVFHATCTSSTCTVNAE